MISSSSDKTLGRSGEQLAARYLKEQGCRILEQNYRLRFGEVDLIVRDRDTLCFVEVKTRRSLAYGPGGEAVVRSKQRQLTRVALSYLQEKNLVNVSARFDVIVITNLSDDAPEIEWFKNAFDALE
jgi:putative endonuclease